MQTAQRIMDITQQTQTIGKQSGDSRLPITDGIGMIPVAEPVTYLFRHAGRLSPDS